MPEVIRRSPNHRFDFQYLVFQAVDPSSTARRLAQAVDASQAVVKSTGPTGWRLALPWTTRVLGFISRQVEETVDVEVIPGEPGPRLLLRCRPQRTHEAHAAGMGGVFLFSVAIWLAGGVTAGIAGGLAALVAGAVWVKFTREMALQALERRLRRMAESMGSAAWPGAPAQVTPRPRPLV